MKTLNRLVGPRSPNSTPVVFQKMPEAQGLIGPRAVNQTSPSRTFSNAGLQVERALVREHPGSRFPSLPTLIQNYQRATATGALAPLRQERRFR